MEFFLDTLYTRIENLMGARNRFSIADQIGLCVLFANKYLHSGEQKYYTVINVVLDRLISTKNYVKSDIINGSTGVLWLLKYLKKIDLIDFSNNQIAPIENSTIKQFNSSLSIDNWGYYTGAIGHLIALDNATFYKLFLDYLKTAIKKDKQGSYGILSISYNESTNLGLHSGILGILSVINSLIKNDCLVKEATEIRKKILHIIFSKLHKTNYMYYPALYRRDYPSRMCWTYGELALSLQLLNTSLTNSDRDMEQEALKMANLAMKRNTLNESGIIDSCVISGSAGNYISFKILNMYFPKKGFDKAMSVWAKHTSDLLVFNDFHTIDRYTKKRKIDLSILEGLIGICLSFDNFETSWYEYILLSNFAKIK